VTCSVPAHRAVTSVTLRTVRSCELFEAFRASPLGAVLSGDVSHLFETYESTLCRVADQFAPAHAIQSRQRPLAPWFDTEYRAIRRDCGDV